MANKRDILLMNIAQPRRGYKIRGETLVKSPNIYGSSSPSGILNYHIKNVNPPFKHDHPG